MARYKTICSCGQLWLSENYSNYDTICHHDGKICTAVKIEKDRFVVNNPNECKEHEESKKNINKENDFSTK